MKRHPITPAIVVSLLAGCGTAAPRPTAPPATPARQRLEVKGDRIVVRGDNGPVERGPFVLHGRYQAAFEQRGAGVDFAREVPFTAHLEQQRAAGAPRTLKLFQRASRSGRTELRASGRWTLAVDYGDSPFEVVLTPLG